MEDYYLAADRRFYEPIERRPIQTADFVDFVRARIDSGWGLFQKSVWINCHAFKNELPVQGWKIHISTTPNDSRKLFETVAAYLIEKRAPFKFLADARTLRMTASKSWSRGASGKFFTVYPIDFEQFKSLLAELNTLTRDFEGPYILSDRRYKDSKVLYYRYGGIRPNPRLQPDGSERAVLVAPDGREVEDVRGPQYRLPDWEAEPFPSEEEETTSAGLNGGRFTVEKALHFSNTGGVYLALDNASGEKVVLKEARARVHSNSDTIDAAAMLRNEHHILERIVDLGIAPRPLALFQEWEHLFLAEEYLEGYTPIRDDSAKGCLFLDTRPTPAGVAAYLKRALESVLKVALAVEALHERGVIWGDISFNNILIQPDTLDIKIIDLESARDDHRSQVQRMFTPGFADPRRLSTAPATIEDDYYGVGAVLLFLLTHANGLLHLKPAAAMDVLRELSRDFGLPPEIEALAAALTHEDPLARPRPSAAIAEVLAKLGPIGELAFTATPASAGFGREDLLDATRFIKANADHHRKDRLFPADGQVYQTNPVSLAHGAAGVLFALDKIEGSVPDDSVAWLLRAAASADKLPPGLQLGSAGVAWALLDLGLSDEARAILARADAHPLLSSAADYSSGLAGWGLAQLRFSRAFPGPVHLAKAEKAGRRLLEIAQERDGGLCWPDKDRVVHYGLHFGASGVALFLLHLSRALGSVEFERAAIRALDFDLLHAVERPEGGLSWHRSDSNLNLVSPYLKNGTAGVGAVSLRFWKILGDRRYLDFIERMHADCDRKYAVFPGRNDGLAGVGEFLLDAYLMTGDDKYRNSARRAASGLKLFAFSQPEGTAFPGNGLARASCDLATGSAGIVLFLDRLLRPRPADFMLDECIGESPR